MAAGHIIGSKCLDASSSANHFWSAVPADLSAGLNSFVSFPSLELGVWYIKTFQDGVLLSSYAAPALNLASCDTATQYDDATLMLVAIMGMWIVAFCARALYRFFRTPNDGT